MSLSGHQSARPKNVEWLTPPEILEPLGDFALDPCAPITRPWPTALQHYTIQDNGLRKAWRGRVWLNPPFSATLAPKWLGRMAEHGNGIALIPARTETVMFYKHVWPVADAICFLRTRPHFRYVDGRRARSNSGAPICLVAYGKANAAILKTSGLGKVLEL